MKLYERLYRLRIKDTNTCSDCGDIENQLHVFYFCRRKRPVLNWFQCTVNRICKLRDCINLKTLFYDINCTSKAKRNTVIIFVTCFLYCIWIGHSTGQDNETIIKHLKNKLCYQRWLLKIRFKDDAKRYVMKEYLDARF